MTGYELLARVSVRASTPSVRVASVPADHVYVRHLTRPDSGSAEPPNPDPVRRLADPTRPWWPPAMLDPNWVHTHADHFDVFHVHFGFDACAPSLLRELVAVLRELGKPFVQTVHDLRNPHHETPAAHDEHLDILVPAADAVITLTTGAADEIAKRWGRVARVIPHPHVVVLEELRRRERAASATQKLSSGRDRPAPFLVGVHLKSMRPCMSGAPVVTALAETIEEMGNAQLRIDVHRDVAEPDGDRHDAALLEATQAAAQRGAQIEVHDFFSDAQLWTYLAGLDVSVLPYRYGTHSGWLEACRDLGTAVAAPTCGYYRDQGPVFSFGLDESGLDPVSLTRAIWAARAAGRPEPLSAAARTAQRHRIAQAHEEIYREVLL